MIERDKLEQIAGGACSNIKCRECPIRKECDHIVYDLRITGPAFALTEEFRAAARAKLAEMDAEGVHSVPPSMRELLKEAVGVLRRGQGDEQANLAQRIEDYLSAPDESALEKVRKIREAVIQEPCEGVQQIGFILTDEAAAALIEPSVPGAFAWDLIEEDGWKFGERSFNNAIIDKIAAKYGVKVGG